MDGDSIKVVLIAAYELGRQPFGLASAAAWLRHAGAAVICLDLAVEPFREEAIIAADLVAFHVPMHTATRLAVPLAARVRALNPRAHLCFFGLYAPMNERYLRGLGADTILGGEFEAGLAALVTRLREGAVLNPRPGPTVSLAKQAFLVPDRTGLPGLARYAYLDEGAGQRRIVGYTEASRGCKHLCRHCPVVPVYGGVFRVVQAAVVLEDIAQQVAAGARHITFGDPDFFNGPGHALRIVEALPDRFPDLTYDVTIKIEHLLTHARFLPTLRETGCILITSAVEAVDEAILAIFDKRHTRADFARAAALCREARIALNPTFVTFTPWTTLTGYLDLLTVIEELGLVESVAPVQYAIRLLIPEGSRLLELPAVRGLVGAFDEPALCYPWVHPDPRVDDLYQAVRETVRQAGAEGEDRGAIFERVRTLARSAAGELVRPYRSLAGEGVPVRQAEAKSSNRHQGPDRKGPRASWAAHHWAPIPRLSEAWYC